MLYTIENHFQRDFLYTVYEDRRDATIAAGWRR